jgi:hypothetical protein
MHVNGEGGKGRANQEEEDGKEGNQEEEDGKEGQGFLTGDFSKAKHPRERDDEEVTVTRSYGGLKAGTKMRGRQEHEGEEEAPEREKDRQEEGDKEGKQNNQQPDSEKGMSVETLNEKMENEDKMKKEERKGKEKEERMEAYKDKERGKASEREIERERTKRERKTRRRGDQGVDRNHRITMGGVAVVTAGSRSVQTNRR